MEWMSLFINFLLDPLELFWSWILLGIIFFLLKRRRTALIVTSLGILWLFIISITPFSQWIVYQLESKYLVWSKDDYNLDHPVNILILGGGHAIAPELPSSGQLMSPAMARLIEGIRIHRQLAGSKLICSGNSTTRRVTQAEMLANSAVDIGVQPEDTLQSRSPKNTMEEILDYKKRFGKNTSLIIVTSGYHMPRVILLCEREGLKVIPAPTDFYLKMDPQKGIFNFKPSVVKIQMLQSALHEYAGIIQVRFLI